MISFSDYAIIKNNYCICYFGHNNEYLTHLRLIRPTLEAHFPGLNIYIGCKDEVACMFSGQDKILVISDMKVRKKEFAHIRELQFNGKTHPVEDILKECDINTCTVVTEKPEKTTKCVLLTKGHWPTRDIPESHVRRIKAKIEKEGYYVEENGNIENAGLVMGVECKDLCEAAAQGIEVKLIKTGIGTRLYKMLFPGMEIIELVG